MKTWIVTIDSKEAEKTHTVHSKAEAIDTLYQYVLRNWTSVCGDDTLPPFKESAILHYFHYTWESYTMREFEA